MPKHYEEKIFDYTPFDIFSLVSDVQSYPSFLPWCLKATIYEKSKSHLLAKLTVGKGLLNDTFTSHVILDSPHSIQIDYKQGPLKHLKNKWQFIERESGNTKVCFDIDFEFKTSILNGLMGAFFQQAFFNMMTSFEDEAYKRFSKT